MSNKTIKIKNVLFYLIYGDITNSIEKDKLDSYIIILKRDMYIKVENRTKVKITC